MDIKLRCSCGEVEGVAVNISPDNGSRVVCCCDDCQAFVGFLKQDEGVLDEFGGTDIFQTSQSQVRFDKGVEQLRCVKLKQKGMVRWYTDCCKTPIANTMSGKNPFVGIIHSIMDHNNDRESDIGPVLAYVQTKHARGTPTYPHRAEKFPLGITLRIVRKMLLWKMQGKNTPSPFFNANGDPVAQPLILQ